MAGAVDLFAGSKSATGANLFTVDKNPLNQLFEGVDDVIGKQAGDLGANLVTGVIQYVQKIAGAIIDAILGLPLELLSSIEPALLQSFQNVDKFFTNILGFLGGIDPLSELFSIETAAQDFVNNILAATGLLPILDGAGHLAQAALQPLIDAIAQSFGLSTGLSFSGLETALASYITTNVIGAVQAVIDAIANALGHSGTGHTPSDILSYLGAIPGTVISGVTTIEQAILDAVANALGHSGTGHTSGDIQTYLGIIPGGNLTGGLNTALTISGNALSSLFNSSGTLASQLTGAINTGVTISGNAVSALFNSSGVLASSLNGALNPAVTFLVGASNISLSTLLQNLNATGQFAAGQLIGSINGAVTLGGTTLSTLVTNINSSGQILGSGITGAINTAVTVSGNTIGNLLQNLNSSGQLVGSAITGAINTAATVGGTAIGTVATNANAAVTNINSLISGVSGTVIADVTGAINTAGTNAQGIIDQVNNAAAGVTSGASTLLSVATTNLAALFGGAPTYLQGLTGSSGQAATNTAYAAAAAAASAQAAQLTAQQSAFNAVFNVSPASAGNINVTVDFSSIANQSGMSGIMLPGSGSGSGYIGVTSGAAAWQGGTGDDIEVFPTQTVTDYQVFDVTLGSLNDLLSNPNVVTRIPFRVNSARNTFMFVGIYSSSGVPYVYLACSVSGTLTTFSASAAGALSTISSGGKLRILAGDPSSLSLYAFQVLYNGTPVITYTDSSHVSQIGSGQRYVGLDLISAVSGKYPPAVRTITYQDNPPAPASYPFSGTPTAGTKGRMYVSNDVGLIQRDNGSAWEYIWGGPLGYLTKPPSTGWSWVNQGSATTATELGGERITAPSSTVNWRIRARTLTPSSNYNAVAYVEVSAAGAVAGSNYWAAGLVLRNSSSSGLIYFGPQNSSSGIFLSVVRFTNSTTLSANSNLVAPGALTGVATPNWLRIRDDGTNRYFDYSMNGVDWILFFSEGRTTFITPDQFGFGAVTNGTGNDTVVRLRSLSGIS